MDERAQAIGAIPQNIIRVSSDDYKGFLIRQLQNHFRK